MKRLLLILSILLLGLSSSAATVSERTRVFNEGMEVCRMYKTSCTIAILKSDKLTANTYQNGTIIISSGMVEVMDEKQLRGVVFHEVGHAVLRHVERTKDYVRACRMGNSCDTAYLYSIMRTYELQADKFATLLVTKLKKPEGLSEALVIITPIKDLFTTSNTHPSTADRVRYIKRIQQEVQ